MNLVFRAATVSDTEPIILLMSRMQQVDPWEQPFDENVLRLNLSELLENPRFGVLHLAFADSHAIGYLVVCFDFSLEYQGRCAWIDEVYVEDAFRGKGIGGQLLDLAEDISRQNGARTLHLEVNHGNQAIELYRRRGFVDHHRYLLTKNLYP